MIKSILLVEDDRDDSELFLEALEEAKLPIKVVHVLNGCEALEVLKRTDRPPDLIFLDINMPIMDGWQCLKKLKEDYSSIPVFMYSTSLRPEDASRAYELGATKFFTKPDSFNALKEMIKKALVNT
jgi:CheY-like chemotaxis protein